jgi:hypothetical protein
MAPLFKRLVLRSIRGGKSLAFVLGRIIAVIPFTE